MEPAPKTTCTRCGTAILQITADLHGGHCIPCVYASEQEGRPPVELSRRRDPEPLLDHLHPAEDVIISIDYDPGWTPDRTSWVIQISNDGVLRQAIGWDRRAGKDQELLDPVILKPSELGEVQQLIGSCSPDPFRSLTSAATIDDVPMVSLVMPAHQLKVSLPYFHLADDVRFDEGQRESFELFSRLWRFADRHAPYRLQHHEKKRR